MSGGPPSRVDPLQVLGSLVERRRGGLRRGSHRALALCEELGSPHLQVPTIHVAGTDGKTSVVRMIASLLRALGVRAGDTTSPHLHHLAERIRLDTRPADGTALAAATADLRRALSDAERRTGEPPTFFDTITAVALRVFADAGCELAVVEAGIGGAGDATNVVAGPVSVLTPIGLDHVELGTTHAEVAANKAGIVRPHGLVVSAAQHPDVDRVVARVVAAQGATLLRAGDDVRVRSRRSVSGGQVVELAGLGGHRYADVTLPLHGAAQADNAAIALAAVQAALGTPELPRRAVREGFAVVELPGRVEVVTAPEHGRTIVVDGAHDELSTAALSATLEERFPDGPVVLVVGTSGGRDPAPLADRIVARLGDRLRSVVATSASAPGSTPPAVLGDRLRSAGGQVVVADDVAGALDVAARAVGASGTVVVTGSLYLAAEARDLARAVTSASLSRTAPGATVRS